MFDRITKEDLQAFAGDRKILLAVRFGSALYGAQTPESDNDIRIVFLPTPREILLGEVDFSLDGNTQSNKLGKGDNDINGYSLVRFLNLLGRFDMGAIEMLFASRLNQVTLHMDPVIDWIYNSRGSLIATADASLLGHARANLGNLAPDNDDYSKVFREVFDAFAAIDPREKLISHIDLLDSLCDQDRYLMARTHDGDIVGDTALEIILDDNRARGTSTFFVLRNRKINLACQVEEIIKVCNSILKKKNKNRGKALAYADLCPKNAYHALRVLDQVIELAVDGKLTFPRPNASLLRRVRSGDVDEAEMRGHVNLYFQTAIEAENDLPFSATRCLKLAEGIIMRAHHDVISDF
jgi:hypothetical protein